MRYFNMIGAVDEQLYFIKCYQLHKFTMFCVGRTYKLTNTVKKPDGLWIVSTTSAGYAKPVDVSDDLTVPLLPEDEPATGAKRTLEQALLSPQRSSVTAKIIKVSPVKFSQEGRLAVRCLGLKDSTGYAKVALFSQLAEETYREGKVVELSGLYKKQYQNQVQLAMTHGTTCQYLSDESISVPVTEKDIEHFKNDRDFCVPDVENLTQFELDAIYEVLGYDCCTNQACHKKKLVGGICPVCEGDSKSWTYRAKVSIVSADNLQKDLTLFQSDVEKLFTNLGTAHTEEDVLENMIDALPVQFSAKLHGNVLYNIQKK